MRSLTKREKVLGLVLGAVLLMGAGQAVDVAAKQALRVTPVNLTVIYPDAGGTCTTINATLPDRKNITLQNRGAVSVFCGTADAGVSPYLNGWEILAGQPWSADYGSNIPICCGSLGAAQTAPNNLRVIEAQ